MWNPLTTALICLVVMTCVAVVWAALGSLASRGSPGKSAGYGVASMFVLPPLAIAVAVLAAWRLGSPFAWLAPLLAGLTVGVQLVAWRLCNVTASWLRLSVPAFLGLLFVCSLVLWAYAFAPSTPGRVRIALVVALLVAPFVVDRAHRSELSVRIKRRRIASTGLTPVVLSEAAASSWTLAAVDVAPDRSGLDLLYAGSSGLAGLAGSSALRLRVSRPSPRSTSLDMSAPGLTLVTIVRRSPEGDDEIIRCLCDSAGEFACEDLIGDAPSLEVVTVDELLAMLPRSGQRPRAVSRTEKEIYFA